MPICGVPASVVITPSRYVRPDIARDDRTPPAAVEVATRLPPERVVFAL
jgi:hypothetical protein